MTLHGNAGGHHCQSFQMFLIAILDTVSYIIYSAWYPLVIYFSKHSCQGQLF
uniref:Uncharacterized protein n=1 Tax=Anguilla anguilla TaxID=7936 RepID=A0A0E9W4R5_ANGAN